MTFRGQFRNGVVVFRKPPRLKDGADVRVEAVRPGKAARRIAKKRLAFHPVGSWDGPPGELKRLLAEVEQMREKDLALEQARQHGAIPA